VSRGGLQRADERVLAPAAKLPPDVRRLAMRMWTRPAFFQALGSQIGSIGESAAEVAIDEDYGDLPLVVVSGEINSDAGQIARQRRLAARARRGRHVVAGRSGHWIPLDRPDVVVDAVRAVLDQAGLATDTETRV
jgi:pimeloyl-ACP methyl ester carboxylesterase